MRILNYGLLWVLLTTSLWAQSLQEAVEQLQLDVENITTSLQSGQRTWGQEEAFSDLNRWLQSINETKNAFSDENLYLTQSEQTEWATSASRVKTSMILLSAETQEKLKNSLLLSEKVEQRLSRLSSRFLGLAPMTAREISQMSLEDDGGIEDIYPNLQALLIDVRDARRLAATLGNNGLGPFVFQSNGPNNLEPVQLRRFILAGSTLENSLSSQNVDVGSSTRAWRIFKREYDRLGYAGSSANIRQLDRVMQRLSDFYAALGDAEASVSSGTGGSSEL